MNVAMLSRLLPADTVVVEAFDDAVPVQLFPAEEQLVRNAVEKRRREFATGRRCARQALAGLGVPAAPLLPVERGAPGWPDGIAGSITHCSGYRAAAVARTSDVLSLGIDAEPNEPLPEGVLAAIVVGAEATNVAELLERDPLHRWDRLLFSAKESVYKTWFPLTRRWLDFSEAEITICPDHTFHARLLVDGPTLPDGRLLTGFSGRWAVHNGLVVTAIAVPAGPVESSAARATASAKTHQHSAPYASICWTRPSGDGHDSAPSER
jgi:4'-phosphopantetheinyl transferase EntD